MAQTLIFIFEKRKAYPIFTLAFTSYRFLCCELSFKIDANANAITPLLSGVPSLLRSPKNLTGLQLQILWPSLLACQVVLVLSVCLSSFLVFFSRRE